MRTPRPIPEILRGRAFTRTQALEAGLTARQLDHARFTLVHPGVYLETGTTLDAHGRIRAAQLALGPRAKVSHETRLFLEGFSFTTPSTWHFTIQGDDHLHHLDSVIVHRTVRLPPCDRRGVTIEHAFLGVLTSHRIIDIVQCGDWLLHRGMTSIPRLSLAADREKWRPGATHLPHVMDLLHPGSASPPESEVRVLMGACGLPQPEVNSAVATPDGEFLARGDLVLRLWQLILEYEGRQHAFDTHQFAHDIGRYDGLRSHGWDYLQITHEMKARPRQLMMTIYQRLVLRGYQGPPPQFGPEWHALFHRCS